MKYVHSRPHLHYNESIVQRPKKTQNQLMNLWHAFLLTNFHKLFDEMWAVLLGHSSNIRARSCVCVHLYHQPAELSPQQKQTFSLSLSLVGNVLVVILYFAILYALLLSVWLFLTSQHYIVMFELNSSVFFFHLSI